MAAHLNLGYTKGRRGNSLQLELPQLPVATGHPALPSIDDKGHVGLVVMHSGEDLLPMAGHSQGGGDEHMLLVPNHGNAHGRPLLGKLPALEHVLVGGGSCWAAIETVHAHAGAAVKPSQQVVVYVVTSVTVKQVWICKTTGLALCDLLRKETPSMSARVQEAASVGEKIG